ncbi:glycosyltransferase family 4 protein [Clostridium sp. A1-XYC3]|uniref:Glycosyltransferase family 4 protein n=1 Tax=Clostridium tanneri TaxID=3037988 RepID=A0ABU4JY27_9CLOT|nr:glycosyltransferase family 4 protein [Clostridium sp. A1-XYC3]MDW8803080.1 glycosyltransferase family 4 protein [Clostridium sp. A1-XYC3]
MSKIKVLQVISGNDNGGGGNHLLNLAYYSKDKFHCVIGALGKGALYDNGKKLGLDVVQFNGKSPYKGEILEYVKKNNIDIVNFHGAKAFFIHYFLRNKLNVPSVATIHSDYRRDFLNSRFKHMFFTPLSIKGLKSFKNYICVSKYIKSLVEKDNFQGEKFLINNGIDYSSIKISESKGEIRSQYNIGRDDFVYVNVARMHPIKNHFYLIEAFNKLKKEIGNIKLVLVGDGELEDKVKEKIKALGLDNDIILTGFKKNSIDFVAASNVSILTSFSEGGSPPLVVLESAAAKKPFICSRVGDIEETINKDRGFLVNPYSVEDIYSKMKEAYDKRKQLNEVGCNLHNFVEEQYSMDSFCNGYYKAYTKILQGK